MRQEPFATLAGISERHARDRPGASALICEGHATRWSDFHDMVLKAVGALRVAGLQRGDRLAFLGYNSVEYLTLLHACYRSGIVMAPLNWRLTPAELNYLLEDSRPAALFVDSAFASPAAALREELVPALRVIIGTPLAGFQHYAAWLAAGMPDASAPVDDPDSLALLLYTSGTTGFPKGALLRHRNLLSGFKDSLTCGGSWGAWADDEVALLATPIFHIGGSGWATQTMLAGVTTVVLPRPEVSAMVEAIAGQRVTKMFAVPALLAMILDDPRAGDADFSTVRHLLYGASPIPLDLLRRAMSKFSNAGFVQLYGATETAGVATWLPAEDHHPEGNARMASCGKPYVGTDIRILSADGAPLPPGTVGEIAIRSGAVMQGYLNRPDASEAALPSGWYRTGDAGFLDADGYLYIHDRVKDMIVSGGENIYPAEIERVLSEHQAVRECAVIGVPDPRWGEAAKAVVALRQGASADADDLRGFLRARLAGYKIPKSVDFVDELPRTPSGKILKRELRKPYWAEDARQVT